MAKNVTRQLDDEYELSQLNPVYQRGGEKETQAQVKAQAKLPETIAMRYRRAVLEAVIDDVIETKIEQAEEEKATAAEAGEAPEEVTPAEVEDAVNPVVDTAVALHLVPSSLKRKIPEMVRSHFRTHNPLFSLMEKAAEYAAEELVDIPENETVIEAAGVVEDKPADVGTDINTDTVERQGPNLKMNSKQWMRYFMDAGISESELDNKPADIGTNIADPEDVVEPEGSTETTESDAPVVAPDAMEADAVGNDSIATDAIDNKPADEGTDIEKEVVELDDCTTQEGGSVPVHQAEALKFLAASCVNKRKATALVSRKVTGVMLSNTLKSLNNVLPAWYKKKYGL